MVEHVTGVRSFHRRPCINMAHNACRGPTRIGLLKLLRKEFGSRRGSMQVPIGNTHEYPSLTVLLPLRTGDAAYGM